MYHLKYSYFLSELLKFRTAFVRVCVCGGGVMILSQNKSQVTIVVD